MVNKALKSDWIGCLMIVCFVGTILGVSRVLFPRFWLVIGLVVSMLLLGLIVLLQFWLEVITNKRPGQWLRSQFGWGLKVEELAQRLKLTVEELREFQPCYTTASIPKRSGGQRMLHIPNPQTKALQKRILRLLLDHLQSHPAAKGFAKNKSIVDHARPHVGRAVVIHLDIIDFFPSTSIDRIEMYFRRIGWNKEAARLLTKMTTWEGGLPQGAPTSPRLSNLVNYYLDVQLTKLAQRRNAVYSRYADDITFSCESDNGTKVRGTIQKIRRMVKSKGYQLHRRKKLHIRRRHQCQEVTGLVVNEKVQLPRRIRHWLRAIQHNYYMGRPISLSEKQLQGWLAYQQMVQESTELSP